MSDAPKPTLAFFGATGGSVAACLSLSLKAGYTCTALARTPEKLQNLLLATSIPASTLSEKLTIIPGDARSLPDIKATLAPANGPAASTIISGLGTPPPTSGLHFLRDLAAADWTICTTTMQAILTALNELALPKPPLLVLMSTTGISAGPRDIPLLCWPLYHYMLAKPHVDKKAMETMAGEAVGKGEKSVEGGVVIVKPSLLTDGVELGTSVVRVGVEAKPAVGYTISRRDVGRWIFEEIVEKGGRKWVGEKVSITY